MVLRDKGAEQNWQIFKDAFHRVQELSVLRVRNQERKARDQHGCLETCWSN